MTDTAHPAPSLAQRLFVELQDGELHAGSALAARLGVSRTAVWKSVSALRSLGMGIDSVARQGYRAAHAYTPLSTERIGRALSQQARKRLRDGEVLWSTASTNAVLLAAVSPEPGCFDYRLAEHQSAGRGRRGRKWFASPGSALCLSLSWSYGALPPNPGALSLAVGIGVWRVLRRFGLSAPRLKWPNDVVLGTRKLCGVLLELRAESAGPALVVVGIGLNCALDAAARSEIGSSGTDPADLRDAGASHADRNRWAAALIAETAATLQTFGDTGFASFEADWRVADALAGAAVVVSGPQGEVQGDAAGIDAHGALQVRTAYGLQRFTSGDVSVRSRA